MHRSLPLAALIALALPATAHAAGGDRDRDGLPDRWERKHRITSPTADPDRDGLENRTEFAAKTDPRRRDSDRDGRADGREDRDRDGLQNLWEQESGHDPADADTDGDGRRDGAEGVGRVVSFAAGVLVLKLADGSKAAGLVPGCGVEVPEVEEPAEEEDGDAPVRARFAIDLEHDDEDSGPLDDLLHEDDDAADDSDAEDLAECEELLEPGAWVTASTLRAGGAGAVWDDLELAE